MSYKLNLNLRQRAAVRAATSIWEMKEVRAKVTEFFKSHGQFKNSEAREPWRLFTKSIVDEFYHEELPKNLEIELIHLVKMIGESIYNWHQYITFENATQYGEEVKTSDYLDVIHWTPYGTVDGVETLKSSWMKNPSLNAAKVYNIACSYALEEYVSDLWNKIPSEIQENHYHNIYGQFNRHILAYWKYHRDNDLSNLMEDLETVASDFEENMAQFNFIYNQSFSPAENMLRLSVHEGYSLATKYFWSQLTDEQRSRNLQQCTYCAVEGFSYYDEVDHSIRDYLKGQYVEICLFLMNQMTVDQKKSFFNTERTVTVPYSSHIKIIDVKNKVLKMLLSTWLSQQLFMPVLEDILKLQDHDSTMICSFLDAITDKMVEDHRLGYPVETNIYRSLLRKVWITIPASVKQSMVQEDLTYNFICDLISVWDLNSLKLILNDPAIAAVRYQFIDLGFDSYEQFIFTDQFDKLDQFIGEFFKLKEDKESFKQTLNVWHLLIDNNLFHLIDKLLDWQCVTPEEKQSIKNSIDHMGLCKDFIEREQYDMADKLLKWKFEIEMDWKKCKNQLKNAMFSIEQVYEIWERYGANLEEATEKLSQFLYWFLDSEEEIVYFKKEKIVNSLTDELFISHLFELDRADSLNNFIKWCSVSKKITHKIRRLMFQFRQRYSWMRGDLI